MVPVRLQLENFLSYGEDVPPLELEGLPILCLSGLNGHGKSALLDAMCWALWGEARKGGGLTRPHAGLIRAGRDEMWVDLEFDYEAARYRVRRSYRRSGKSGRLQLDLLCWDPADETWRVLTLSSAAATQQRIDALLRMDYDTFINSAFLMQGRADEFTQRPPTERKQVLGEILGLSHYDQLSDLARSRRAELEREQETAAREAARLELELQEWPEVREALAAATAAVRELEQSLAADEQEHEILRARLDEDTRRRERLHYLEPHLARLEAESSDLSRELAERQSQVTELERLLAERDEVAAAVARLAAVEEERAEVERALLRRRELEAEQHRLTAEIARQRTRVEGERMRLDERRKQVLAKRAEAEGLVARRDEIRHALDAHSEARRRLEEMEQTAAHHRALVTRHEVLTARIERLRVELVADQRAAQQQARELGPRAAALTELRQRLEQTVVRLGAAESATQELDGLERRLAELEVRFEGLKARDEQVGRQLGELQQHERLLAAGGGRCPVCGQALNTTRREELAAEYATQRGELETGRDRLRDEARQLKADRAAGRARIEELADQRQEARKLEREVARLEQAAQEAARAETELHRLESEQAELGAQLSAQSFAAEDAAELRQVRLEMEALDYDPERHRALRREVDDARGVESEAVLLARAETSMAEADAELPQLNADVAALDSALNAGEAAAAEAEALAALELELRQVQVTDSRLAALDRDRRALADAPRRMGLIEDAATRLPDERRLVERGRARLESLETQRNEAGEELERLGAALLDREADELRRTELEGRIAAGRNELAGRREQRGELLARQERLERQRAELGEVSERLGRLGHQRTVADHLVTAFGRNGIPALIIENAVPEIEAAANEVLGRLTEQRMYLAIQLQRQLQSGGEKETLDLAISDELGSRSYENYSGGEAFRINFALRLALSRLLAQRAGARLRTLIVDEGFGTQDEDGLEQLVEAIHAVRDDFDRILVVTHLTALKEHFPVRVEVYKEPEVGSRFELVGVPHGAA